LPPKAQHHPGNAFVARQLTEVEQVIGRAAASRRQVRRERAAAAIERGPARDAAALTAWVEGEEG
jgi:hypothetical protein